MDKCTVNNAVHTFSRHAYIWAYKNAENPFVSQPHFKKVAPARCLFICYCLYLYHYYIYSQII